MSDQVADPGFCPICGRDSCDDVGHLPPDPLIECESGGHTVADMALRHLADDEAALIDHMAALTAERYSFRELARAAIAELADLKRRFDRLQESHWRLIDEYRFVREEKMRQPNKGREAA